MTARVKPGVIYHLTLLLWQWKLILLIDNAGFRKI